MLASLPEHWTARNQTVRFVDAGLNRLALEGTALAKPLYRQSSHVDFSPTVIIFV